LVCRRRESSTSRVEDTVCAVHPSWGRVAPISPLLLSGTAIVCRIDRAVPGDGVSVDWAGFEDDHDRIRDHIAHVVHSGEAYAEKTRIPGGFVPAHGPRDTRTFPTPSGRALLTVNHLEHVERPAGRLILQTLRAHDQFNTTIYSLNDRCRGVHDGCGVIFVNPADLDELDPADGQLVDVHSEYADGVDRTVLNHRVVACPTVPGCAPAYFPEANALVSLDAVAEVSNTPVSKSFVVRREPGGSAVAA
jgi:formate dehydrogenase major subunit